jgi:histone deacetylase 4/5
MLHCCISGSQNTFYNEANVLFFSIHRGNGFYPGTGEINECGEGEGLGFNINVPLPGRQLGDHEYMQIFETVLLPVARAWQPDLIVVSAGFDAALGDPLGALEVTPACYAWMTHALLQVSNGKVVVALEGGYNTDAISQSYANCVHVLLGDTVAPPDVADPHLSAYSMPGQPVVKKHRDQFLTDLDIVIATQRTHWPCLASVPAARAYTLPGTAIATVQSEPVTEVCVYKCMYICV